MRITSKRVIWHMTGIAAAVVLAGCGGGSTVVDQPASVEYTLSGTAAKGPLHKAKVTAYKLNENGSRGDKLGESKSDKGAYSIKYPDYTGPILVEVEATDETEMADEATGAMVKPVGLMLKSAVQPPVSVSARTFTVQVNPLTTNAVAAAVRKGGLTKTNIEQANKDLRESMGFDPLTVAPEFDASNKPTNPAGVVLAAISQLAKDGDVAACKDKADTAAKVTCVVGELDKSAFGDLKVPALQSKIDQVAAAANVDPPKVSPPTNTPAEVGALAQAKALMTTLRSNAKALDATDLSLQTQLTAVQDEVTTRVRPVVDSTFEMLRTMDFGVQLLEDAQNSSGLYRSNRLGTQYGAGCAVYTDNTFRTEATTAANAKTVGCSSYIVVNRDVQDATTGQLNTWRWRHRLLIEAKSDAPGAYAVKTTARREYGTCSTPNSTSCGTFTQTYVGTADQGKPVPAENYPAYSVQRGQEGVADFTRTFTEGNLTALRLTGTTAPSLYYQGLSVSPVLDNGRGRRHEVELDVVKTVANGVQKLSLNSDAVIKFFSSDQQGAIYFMSSIGVGKDSFIEAPVNTDARDGTEKFDLRVGYVAGNSAIRGQLAASDGKWDKSQTHYVPTKATFGGRLERRADVNSPWVEFLRGNIVMEMLDYTNFFSNQPVSANNPQKIKATLNAVLTIPTRPVLYVKDFVINNTDKGASGATVTLTGQYIQGSVVIHLDGNGGSAANGHKAVLTLTSSEGIKMVYDGSKSVHPMTKSDVKVGEFNESTNRLTYSDNTFEQF
ncbi:MAG: hypothetical protein Q7J58_01600 [Hydrogenophaga sp.]|uniref:hypothetical protein n=1 Tax=Hydrogenophaga sp. TaxID=1904254 RepID=UPI0027224BEA|nr:hypothetical protein [Hydrogenophaga sp.]MDO9568064.1 hypothetical protein [Hydrogenophaga sp.]MDP3375687.1 hypothetical protein [Hydrogenophaga sp.]